MRSQNFFVGWSIVSGNIIIKVTCNIVWNTLNIEFGTIKVEQIRYSLCALFIKKNIRSQTVIREILANINLITFLI
jgi:hypothetical protein